MVILGLDPGTAITGFGIIQASSKGATPKVLTFGTIVTPAKMEITERLFIIHKELSKLINKYHPDFVAIEEIFFNTNDTTAVTVSEARGVMLLTCRIHGVQVFEYTPLQAKSAIVGYGRAEKKQVQFMVEKILKLNSEKKKIVDDAYDALALALTHFYSYNGIIE